MKLLFLVSTFVLTRSFLDYVVCMFFLKEAAPYWGFYASFLFWSGLLIPLYLKKLSLPFIMLGSLSVFLAENTFYVWVSVFGDLNGAYGWYTGNPLNPDGNFGYSWTNPLGMIGYFQTVVCSYLGLNMTMSWEVT